MTVEIPEIPERDVPHPEPGETIEGYTRRVSDHLQAVIRQIVATCEAQGEPVPDWIAAIRILTP
jgi:hypothetical protein